MARTARPLQGSEEGSILVRNYDPACHAVRLKIYFSIKKKVGIGIYIYNHHFNVQQKLTEHCKSTICQ